MKIYISNQCINFLKMVQFNTHKFIQNNNNQVKNKQKKEYKVKKKSKSSLAIQQKNHLVSLYNQEIIASEIIITPNSRSKIILYLQSTIYKHQYKMYHFFSHHKLIQGDYDLKQIQIEQQLGRGNSHVYTAIINNKLCALKQIQIKDDFQYKNMLQQIKLMRQLSQQSTCMVKYYGFFITTMQIDQYTKHKYAFIIMQCAQMNLQQLVVQFRQGMRRFTIQNIERFIGTILNGLCELEEKHIAHCDIKPENVLIMNSVSYQLKLCDVGSCKVVTGENMEEATILGTVPFLAPELIKIKSKKLTSSNPFKSDVFSFGLVVLYIVTFKKFKSQQRLEVQQTTYKQIINEWVKQANELVNFQFIIGEILKMCLDFDENKRPMFEEIRGFFVREREKKVLGRKRELEEWERTDEEKMFSTTIAMDSLSLGYQSSPGNFINLFKSRKTQKSVNKPSTNGTSSFRITTTTGTFNSKPKSTNRNLSPINLNSSFIKKKSLASTASPENLLHFGKTPHNNKTLNKNSSKDKLSTTRALYNSNQQYELTNNRIIYVNEKTMQVLQRAKTIQDEEEKTFALEIPLVTFKRADTVAVLPQCSLEVVRMLENVQANRLNIEYEKVEGMGLGNDAPILRFPKIRINLSKSSLQGGYKDLFRSICNPQLQTLQLRLTQSQVTFEQIIQLIDSLQRTCPKLNTLLLSMQKQILSQDQHFTLTQKISKLPLKRLSLIMNQNYIKYDKQMPWLLPKQCENLYLQYGHNLLNSIINNLCLSLGSLVNLKQLYLNFQNNNLLKGEINMISKSIAELKQLEKIILDVSLNQIDDINYLQKNLSQHINLQVIEVRLHRTETSIERCVELIMNLKELFEFKLKILKVYVNRVVNIKSLKDTIESLCVQKGVKKIISDVIGFDNSYFIVYLKKKPRVFARGTNKGNSTSVRKEKLQSPIIKFNNTLSMTNTLSGFNPHSFKKTNPPDILSPKPASGFCARLYTNAETYDNFMCLGCCEAKQTSKNTFYCKFCIEHCYHKGHNIVKVYSRTQCSCSHSGHCQSDSGRTICAQKLKIIFKKKIDCIKCEMSFCIVCAVVCKEFHPQFIRENKENTFFSCAGSKHKQLFIEQQK